MSGLVYDTTLLESDAIRMSVAPELHGRRQIFTSEREITDANVIDVLEKAMDHLASLIETELGGKVRKAVLDRNNTVVDLL